MSSPPPSSDASGRASSSAEEAYAEFLRRLDAGEDIDFERFCASRPQLVQALRILHSAQGDAPVCLSADSLELELRRRCGAESVNLSSPLESAVDPSHAPPLDSARSAITAPPGVPATAAAGADAPSGKYTMISEIARGGMGVIHRVWDGHLHRPLAMKVMIEPPAGGDDSRKSSQERLSRFVDEAQITGQLSHPGIVPVHDLGIDAEGRVFFTMRLVRGEDLRTIFRKLRAGEGGWTQMRVLGVFVKVCEALAYAHSKGVIHRDLKPANIMVGRFGETYVMDWGLARVIGRPEPRDLRPRTGADTVSRIWTDGRARAQEDPDDELVTQDGTILGTPVYMPPEQAAGRREELDSRSDVYSVGAMLYELLTGRMPFVSELTRPSPATILSLLVSGPPRPVHLLAPDTPPELAAICEKAMARHPGIRYPSTKEMAEDLQAYLENRVVKAYRTGAAAELRKWVVRNRGTAGAIAAAVVLVAAALVAVIWIQARAAGEILLRSDVYAPPALARIAETELWPALPEKVPAMEKWLERARDLVGRLELHRRGLMALREGALPYDDAARRADRERHPRARELAILDQQVASAEDGAARAQEPPATADSPEPKRSDEDLDGLRRRRSELAAAIGERRTWTFATAHDQLEHDSLAALVSGLERLLDEDTNAPTIAGLESRLYFARNVERLSIGDHRAAWDRAMAEIADPRIAPRYRGLAIAPQLGLVPLGPDPRTGLWEFAALQTGRPPERRADGSLAIDEDSALVLILVPGGSFAMGAALPGPGKPPGSPNVDPGASASELPVHDVALEPFFISKFEMTQGQWLRSTGQNPSYYAPTHKVGEHRVTLLHPVENVSWDTCTETLRRLGLRLPTEAQWEYAARAGTATVWWTGDDRESLRDQVNVADQAAARLRLAWPAIREWPEHDDGFVAHAPVGTFPPNPFGLHEIYGNVWEWCRDEFSSSSYRRPLDPQDGEHLSLTGKLRANRGGGYYGSIRSARSASRTPRLPGFTDGEVGLRPARSIMR